MMQRGSTQSSLSNQTLRILVAIFLIPLVFFCLWRGPPVFDGLVWLATVAIFCEWALMVRVPAPLRWGTLLLFPLCLLGFFIELAPWQMGLLCLTNAIMSYGLASRLMSDCSFRTDIGRIDPAPLPLWVYVIGVIYFGASLFLLLWLRHEGYIGVLLWMMGIVWTTDSGAYFSGRRWGGTKLAPKISPNKTWSGLVGGLFLSTLLGTFLGARIVETLLNQQGIHLGSRTVVLLTSILALSFSVIAHLGDLMISKMKRLCHVKDSGILIPGHGGVLDRLDSFLPVCLIGGLIIVWLEKRAGGW